MVVRAGLECLRAMLLSEKVVILLRGKGREKGDSKGIS